MSGNPKTLDGNQDVNVHEICLDFWSDVNDHNHPAIWAPFYICGMPVYSTNVQSCLT